MAQRCSGQGQLLGWKGLEGRLQQLNEKLDTLLAQQARLHRHQQRLHQHQQQQWEQWCEQQSPRVCRDSARETTASSAGAALSAPAVTFAGLFGASGTAAKAEAGSGTHTESKSDEPPLALGQELQQWLLELTLTMGGLTKAVLLLRDEVRSAVCVPQCCAQCEGQQRPKPLRQAVSGTGPPRSSVHSPFSSGGARGVSPLRFAPDAVIPTPTSSSSSPEQHASGRGRRRQQLQQQQQQQQGQQEQQQQEGQPLGEKWRQGGSNWSAGEAELLSSSFLLHFSDDLHLDPLPMCAQQQQKSPQ